MLNAPKVDPELIAAVLNKIETGPVIEENDWNRNYINRTIHGLISKYDISWESCLSCFSTR